MIFDLSIPDIVVPIISSNIVLCSNTMYASKREELKEESPTNLLTPPYRWEQMYHYAREYCLLVLIIPVIKLLDNKE